MRINNSEYFQTGFKAPDLLEVFTSITNEQDYVNDKSCLFFLTNLKAMGKKNPYLALKWLIVTHQLLRMPLYFKVVEDIYLALETIKAPFRPDPFETYLFSTLIKVYLQYLLKFCLLKLRKGVTRRDRCESYLNEVFFMMVNLLKFGTKEFMVLIPEFHGFF